MLKRRNATRKILGIKSVGNGYILRDDDTEMYFFKIQPYNLAVLSDDVILGKIDSFVEILKSMDEISILCLDGAEDFSDNRTFLARKIREEKNPVIKKLLQIDQDELSVLQQDINTSRAFVLCFRILAHKKKDDLVRLSHLVANAKDSGLMISQYSRDDLKRLLMIYHKQDVSSDYLVDIDGDQYLQHIQH